MTAPHIGEVPGPGVCAGVGRLVQYSGQGWQTATPGARPESGRRQSIFLNTIVPLVPPKPNELDKATRISSSRALFAV